VQLALALVGSVALVVLGLNTVGGLSGLSTELSMAMNPSRLEEVLAFSPPAKGLSFLSVQAFSVYLLIRWWASPTGDGGGYIAQRLMAARSPEDARQAAGIFVVFHYVLRPWPWILVGLIGLVVFPVGDEASVHAVGQLVQADREMAYPALASIVMGPGVLGLLLVSLLAAFMSTVDTHLNWGVSYVANDLWKVYVRPSASPREIVRVGRIASVGFAVMALLVANQIGSVEQAWKFVAALGSGLGLPVLLRWLWWRTNAQAEIAGALGSLAVTLALVSGGEWSHPFFGIGRLPWEYEFALAVVAGAVAALSAIWIFGPPDSQTLADFYERVRPPGLWAPVRRLHPVLQDDGGQLTLGRIGLAWTLGAIGLGAGIFAPGHLLLGSPLLGGAEALVAVLLALTAWHLTRGRG
jgi:Na+/proline symporter